VGEALAGVGSEVGGLRGRGRAIEGGAVHVNVNVDVDGRILVLYDYDDAWGV
jgi:hypothetical protein